MTAPPDPDKATSFSSCRVQLNVFSLMLLTGLSGLCGGIAWALILVSAEWLSIIELESFKGPSDVLIGFPIIGAVGGALFAVVGYPLYSWVCKNLHGQRLRGTFYDPRA